MQTQITETSGLRYWPLLVNSPVTSEFPSYKKAINAAKVFIWWRGGGGGGG